MMIRPQTTREFERCEYCDAILTEAGECQCDEIDWKIQDALDEPDGYGLGIFRGIEFSLYLWFFLWILVLVTQWVLT